MEIGRIENATRVIGKSQGYIGLPLRDETIVDCTNGKETPVMVSAWYPTMEELQALIDGAPIHLRLFGTVHPPVMILTGDTPSRLDN